MSSAYVGGRQGICALNEFVALKLVYVNIILDRHINLCCPYRSRHNMGIGDTTLLLWKSMTHTDTAVLIFFLFYIS